MALGKLVGEAYVLMRADGTLMKSDMTRAAQSAARAAGKDAGKTFRKEWTKEFNRAQSQLDEGLARSFARMAGQRDFRSFIRQYKSIDDATKAINKNLDLMVKKQLITETQRKKIERGYRRSVALILEERQEAERIAETERARAIADEAARRLEVRLRKQEKQAVADVLLTAKERAEAERVAAKEREVATAKEKKDENDLFVRRIRNLTTLDHRVTLYKKREVARIKEVARAEEVRVRETEKAESDLFKRRIRNLTTMDSRMRKIAKIDINLHPKKFHEDAAKIVKDLDKAGYHFTRVRSRIIQTDRSIHRLGSGIGRVFGKGARNDFLNAIGVGVGLLSTQLLKLVSVVPKLVLGVAEIGGGFKNAASVLKGGGGFGAALGEVGAGFSRAFAGPQGIIAAVGALVGGIILFGKIVPGITSAVLGLASGLGAMAAVMINGVAAGLLTIIPLAVSAVSAFGVLGYTAYQWVQSKSGKKALKEFNAELKTLTKELLPQIKRGFDLISGAGTSIFRGLVPELDKVLDRFYRLLDQKGTKTALGEWRETIISAGRDLTDAALTFSAGLIQFFRPILPYVKQFAQYLSDSATDFFRWTRSAEGQNSIRDWFTGAISALEDTVDLLGEIFGLIGDIFFTDPAQSAGKNLIRDLAGWIRDIRNDLKENPDGLRAWFRDAESITRQVGSIATSIGEIFANLSSAEGRQAASDLLDTFKGFTDLVGTLASFTSMLEDWADYILIVGDFMTGDIAGAGERWARMQARHIAEAAREAKKLADETARASRSSIFDADGVRGAFALDVQIKPDTALFNEATQLIEDFKFSGKLVDVGAHTEVWDAVKGTVAGFIFDPKTVPVSGDSTMWDDTKALVEQYQFKGKIVDINAPSEAELYSLRSYIESKIEATAKVRVVLGPLPNGSQTIGGGVPQNSAMGGIINGPTHVFAGEGGLKEAIVPLERPLSLVDPSVRELAAFAQGKRYAASGGVYGGGSVVVQPGAVQVSTQATSPSLVGSIVLDGIADALSAAR